MFLGVVVLLFAIAISGVAAWYSIIGLIAIFPASPVHIAIMGGVLEGSKLVCASWLYNHWDTAPKLLKIYLTTSLIVLVVITSMGIFGFLSKSHLESAQGTVGIESAIKSIEADQKFRTERIASLQETTKNLDKSLDQLYNRGLAKSGVTELNRQTTTRKQIDAEITTLRREWLELEQKKTKAQEELTVAEVKVGPIKYVAEMIFGESDKNLLARAVRYLMIVLVCVFDPLAIVLSIAANISLQRPKTPVEEPKKKSRKKIPILPDTSLGEYLTEDVADMQGGRISTRKIRIQEV